MSPAVVLVGYIRVRTGMAFASAQFSMRCFLWALSFLTLFLIGRIAAARVTSLSNVAICKFAFGDQVARREARRILIEEIIERESRRVGELLTGVSYKWRSENERIEIYAEGLTNGRIYLKGHFGFLKADKSIDLDYLPTSYGEAGPNPFVTFVVDEVRVQSYSDKEDPFRRKGIGTGLLNVVVDLIRLFDVNRVSGRFDQTNKEMFLGAYRNPKNSITDAIEATFSGQVFKARGFSVDPENSLVCQHTDRSCEPSSIWVTRVLPAK